MERPYLLRRTRSFNNLTARVALGYSPFIHLRTNAPAVPVLGVDGVATDISNWSKQVVEKNPAREENPVMEETGVLAETAVVEEAVVVEQTVVGEETLVAEERQGVKRRSSLKKFLRKTLKAAYMAMRLYDFSILKRTATTSRVEEHDYDSVHATHTAPTFQEGREDYDSDHSKHTSSTFQKDTGDCGSVHSMHTAATSPVEDVQEISSAFPLLELPTEIVLQVMLHLPAPSLYCLRQTSTRLMTLFDTHHFRVFHGEPESSGNHKRFAVSELNLAQGNDVVNSLHHDMYCAACLAAEKCGTIDKRLETLRSLQYCRGCGVLHARALFPEDDAAYSHAPGEQICIGRLERLTVCDHRSARSLSWLDIAHFPDIAPGNACEIACTHRSHQPKPKSGRLWENGSAFPRFFAQDQPDDGVTHIGYGWDLPLLDLQHRSDHTLRAIQERLSKLVVDALHNHNHRLCPHISADKEIRNFVQSGICNCFAKHDTRYVRLKAPWPKACECGRQVTLECRICGAVYMWHLAMGQVILSLRYLWYIQKPTSFGWLGLLGFHMKFSSQENQHVLWCDTPNCRTNKRRRWEALVKEDTVREYFEDQKLESINDDEQDDDSSNDDSSDDDSSDADSSDAESSDADSSDADGSDDDSSDADSSDDEGSDDEGSDDEEQDNHFTDFNGGFDYEEMERASEKGSFRNW